MITVHYNTEHTVVYRQIAARVEGQLERGLLDEVRRLLTGGLGGWITARQAIGYAEMARHLEGELSLQEAVALTVKRTKALARRQMAWFRRNPAIHWVANKQEAVRLAEKFLGR